VVNGNASNLASSIHVSLTATPNQFQANNETIVAISTNKQIAQDIIGM